MSRIYKEYDLLLQIGAGTFSTVYKAKRKTDGLLVAIKVVEAQSENEVNLILTEANVLKHLMGGPSSIPKIYDFFNEGPIFFIIMEFLDGYITLLEWTNTYSSLIFNGSSNNEDVQSFIKAREEDIFFIFYQILLAVNYLHQKSVIHRDLKLENIMFNPRTRTIKLIDFGFSIITKTMVWSTICGSFEYLAPEILQDLINDPNEITKNGNNPSYTTQSEVYSHGIILYGMIFCRLPFFHQNRLKLINLVLNSKVSYEPEKAICNPGLRTLLESMLEKDPTVRISFSQLLNNPLFADLNKNVRKSISYKTGIHKITLSSIKRNCFKPDSLLSSQYKDIKVEHNEIPQEEDKNFSDKNIGDKYSSDLNPQPINIPISIRNSYNQKYKHFAKICRAFPLKAKILAPKLIAS